jgi:hypothetical protein
LNDCGGVDEGMEGDVSFARTDSAAGRGRQSAIERENTTMRARNTEGGWGRANEEMQREKGGLISVPLCFCCCVRPFPPQVASMKDQQQGGRRGAIQTKDRRPPSIRGQNHPYYPAQRTQCARSARRGRSTYYVRGVTTWQGFSVIATSVGQVVLGYLNAGKSCSGSSVADCSFG